jgi:hypothetical protein
MEEQPATEDIQATRHNKRKRHHCLRCGVEVFNLSPHTKTCKGTRLRNKKAQVSGLQKGQSEGTRRTRATVKVIALPRLLRVDGAGALAELGVEQLKTQPLSVRGWALPPVITTTAPDAARVTVLETVRRLIPIGQRPRIMVFPSQARSTLTFSMIPPRSSGRNLRSLVPLNFTVEDLPHRCAHLTAARYYWFWLLFAKSA